MPVSLTKSPRDFSVLMQYGTVHGVLLTPDTEEERDHLRLAIGYAYCVDICEVIAVDRYEAAIRAIAIHDREAAIEDYMASTRTGYRAARALYRDCRTWARALTPEGRASWLADGPKSYAPLKRFALVEAMREFGETTSA
ncbi:hypothetical protein [Streptomyces sp. NPDC020965]|uniref:hypothetical protein n=1 Tax=Streptomyces sp. NPDC020965 TaxID=3365105 RepID=UPI00379DDC44